ncbi:MAG TPA: prepilin-type N-terminal cleavage/methylation domain-containing protein [Smithellaceae bacterium]|nr:prepilin-type N-terminal cleavage/methylation domain-containing protein [Smithellaceae bacterium]
MKKKNLLGNQKGFTLIEIIAVLIILGVIAAVAVPKFVDMQAEARQYAVDGALGALQSTVTMDYAKQLLTTPSTTTYTPTASEVVVGEFTGTIANAAGAVTITITAGPSWFNSSAGTNSKSFSLY